MKPFLLLLLIGLPAAFLPIGLPVQHRTQTAALPPSSDRPVASRPASFPTGEAVQQRIERVEEGLTDEVIALEGSPVRKRSLADRMKHYRVNGLSVAVINGDTIEWAKAYGVTDAGTREPVTTGTLFQTASIGKMVTALAALQLVRAGRVGLDEDVNRKLTSWQVPENAFTPKKK